MMESYSSLVRATRVRVLRAVSREDADRAVVHADRDRDLDDPIRRGEYAEKSLSITRRIEVKDALTNLIEGMSEGRSSHSRVGDEGQ